MKIGFIGAGRVGTAFGKYLSSHGYNISGYYSRSYENAEISADFVGGNCTSYHDIIQLICSSDLIFITVNDGAITEISHTIAEECQKTNVDVHDKMFCHTSGANSSEILFELEQLGAKTAGIHMLLAVNDKFSSDKDFQSAFFTIDGCADICSLLENCGNEFQIISPENKQKYHAAAVFASNFVVALAEISCNLLEECGFSYKAALTALSPLLKANTENIINIGPRAALTGPIERGDFDTVKKHLKCFSENELGVTAKNVYIELSKALIMQTGNIPDMETIENLKINTQGENL